MIGEYIPDSVFEKDAKQMLEQCKTELKWPASIIPVKVDEIIEFHCGLNVDWADLTAKLDNPNVLAAISFEKNTIYMNVMYEQKFKSKRGLMNFTCAHELGHWKYHAPHKELCSPLWDGGSYGFLCRMNKRDRIELQADHFAAALLMPEDIITNAFLDIPELYRYKWHALYSLAEDFEVTISALVNRLKHLNLIYVDANRNIFRDSAEAFGQSHLF